MHDPGAYPRPEQPELDLESRSMLRALLLCELIEQIDRAVVTSMTGAPRADGLGLAPALLRMTEIRDALDRLDDGSYGICDTCSHQIPIGELKVAPGRRACARCQPPRLAGAHHLPRNRRSRRTRGLG